MLKNVLFTLMMLIFNKMAFGQRELINEPLNVDKTQSTQGHLQSPIRSLSTDEYNAYKTGLEMGMSKVAEVNNYPAPIKVLELGEKLKLTASQRTELTAVDKELKRKAIEMGVFILDQEKKLNDLFASGKVNDGTVIYHTGKIGLFLGELRNAHLQAHLKAHQVLTPDQRRKYKQLNAYSK